MNPLAIYKKIPQIPMKNQIFMKLLCQKAPYFGSISPVLLKYNEGECLIKIRKRRKILNHIGTVHAIAMCNAAELTAGLTIDSCLPKNLRWIPKKMQVEYLKKAETDLLASCQVKAEQFQIGDNMINVELTNDRDEIVFCAKITMYVSEKKS